MVAREPVKKEPKEDPQKNTTNDEDVFHGDFDIFESFASLSSEPAHVPGSGRRMPN